MLRFTEEQYAEFQRERALDVPERATRRDFESTLAVMPPADEKPPQNDFVRLIVYGSPAPQGSKSYKGQTKTGRAILVESSKAVKPWRQDVRAAAIELIQARGLTALDGPLVARMVFTLRKPLSAPKKKRTWPAVKPDLSKLCRSTEDALVDAGLIADDSCIVNYSRLSKVYPLEDGEALHAPGVVIELRRIEA